MGDSSHHNPILTYRHAPTYLTTTQSHPGLVNMGNTCYLAVVLQMLKFDRPFLQGLFTWAFPTPAEVDAMDPAMKPEERAGLKDLLGKLGEIRRCLAFMLLGRDKQYSVDRVVAALSVNHNIQEDGLEFYQSLLTKVEESRRHLGSQDNPFLQCVVFGVGWLCVFDVPPEWQEASPFLPPDFYHTTGRSPPSIAGRSRTGSAAATGTAGGPSPSPSSTSTCPCAPPSSTPSGYALLWGLCFG